MKKEDLFVQEVFSDLSPVVIAKNISQATDQTRDWNIASKSRWIYPITQALYNHAGSSGYDFIRQVALSLCGQDKKGGYRAAFVDLELDSQAVPLFLPVDVFDPRDPWGRYFRKSLGEVDFWGKSICEVGVGSGSVAIELLKSKNPPQGLILNDIDPRV